MQSTQPIVVESLGIITLVVEDQDAALDWYQDTLGFEVAADESFEMDGETGRWLTITPASGQAIEISLVAVDDPMYEQFSDVLESRLGTDQMWTFNTPDIDAAVEHLADKDVDVDDVREMPWGRFVMFRDLDGNELQLYENAGIDA